MPPSTLRRAFPEAYDRTRTYVKFAMIRDPLARFPSSLTQRLQDFGPKPMHLMSRSQIVDAVRDTIERLTDFDERGVDLPYDWIHFRRQTEYTADDDWPVQFVAPVERVDELVAAMARYVDRPRPAEDGRVARDNAALVFGGEWSRSIVGALYPLWEAFVPSRVRTRVGRALKPVVMVPRQSVHRDLFADPSLVTFLRTYYARDVDAWASAEARWAEASAMPAS